jgi:apolipoprotein N-acyltransferase
MFDTLIPSNLWDKTPRWMWQLMIFTAGGLAGLGQAPIDAPALTLLGLGFGLWAIQKSCDTSSFSNGWLLGSGYFAVSLAWIMQPFLVDLPTTGWMAPFALAAMAGGLALFWGVTSALVKGRAPLLICLALLAAEVARSYVFSGFPWGLIGYVWIDTPLYKLAAVMGPYGMTLLTLVMAYVVAHGRLFYAVALIAFAVVLQILPNSAPVKAPHGAAIVRLIHPNVAQSDKWNSDKMEGIYQRHMALTQADPPVDLIVWSETSVYLPIDIAKSEIAAVAQDAPIIVGYQSSRAEGLYFNTLGIISPQGELQAEYHKSRLVPFGEYLPLAWVAGWFGLQRAGFSSGDGPSTLKIDGIGQIQPLICYEGIFPQFVGRSAVRPDLLILITNDAWFGEGQGPAQHFAQARARAIELGLPMVRVANRGVSTVIDPRGGYGARLQGEDTGFVDVPLPARLPTPFFAIYPWAATIFMALWLCVAAFWRRSRT